MTDIKLDELLSKASNDDFLGRILSDIEKYGSAFDKISALYDKLEKSGVIPSIIKIAGKKYDVDVETPLRGVTAPTDTHKAIFQELNGYNEADLKKYIGALNEIIRADQSDKP